ncbi:MAG: protein-glutamate O-methyltransferase CheR [Chloroflexi bacterium]|nr:protein-glutamate O-methyltransferase CheR [Chloroflexota bacterium]
MIEQDYRLVYRKIKRLTGIDLSYYKGRQVQRRLEAYLRRSGAANWREYLHRLEQDPQEVKALRDYLTINVSCFFRDPHKFQYLREKILPELVRPGGKLHMWSAGCSYGAEAYTLAILGDLTRARWFQVWATDVDRGALTRARAGGPYTDEDVKYVAPDLLKRYFDRRDDGFYVKRTLRRHVVFEEHNLLEDQVTREFDLVLCRNVIIYFSDEAKRKVLTRLVGALRPDGVLFIGGTEVISTALARELGLQSAGISFYRKMAHVMEGVV